MANTKYPSIVMFSTHPTNLSQSDWKDEYEDFLDMTDITEEDLSLEDFIAEGIDIDWQDFKDNLRYGDNQVNQPCLVCGILGLWDGKHPIVPTKCDNLLIAIEKCVNKSDIIEITLNDGIVNVSATHHDGTNTFEIRLLNDKGQAIQDCNKLIKYTKKYVGYLY